MSKCTINLLTTNRISGAELFRTFIFVFVILINVAMGFLKLFFFKFFNDCQIRFSVWQVDTEFFDRKKRDGYSCQYDNVQIPKSIQSFSNLASIINNAAMKEAKVLYYILNSKNSPFCIERGPVMLMSMTRL